jgi:hypothetical protein
VRQRVLDRLDDRLVELGLLALHLDADLLAAACARSRTTRGNLLHTLPIGCMRVFMTPSCSSVVMRLRRCVAVEHEALGRPAERRPSPNCRIWLRASTSSPTEVHQLVEQRRRRRGYGGLLGLASLRVWGSRPLSPGWRGLAGWSPLSTVAARLLRRNGFPAAFRAPIGTSCDRERSAPSALRRSFPGARARHRRRGADRPVSQDPRASRPPPSRSRPEGRARNQRWGERGDSNPRPPGPQPGALTG